jgi:N-acetylglutamate synthase-like GNAT family acetyltransferase
VKLTDEGVASIRRSTIDDLPGIERLLTESSLPTAGVADMMAKDAASFYVAEASGQRHPIVGVAGLEACGENALLRSVAVRPEWRSRGVGNELVSRVVSDAEARGLNALYLLTLTAERYFPRFGFERVERKAVPAAVAETVEFKSACPDTATVMMRRCC